MLGWRNGRRTGLKILRPQGHVGSTPAPSTVTGVKAKSGATKSCGRKVMWVRLPPQAPRHKSFGSGRVGWAKSCEGNLIESLTLSPDTLSQLSLTETILGCMLSVQGKC